MRLTPKEKLSLTNHLSRHLQGMLHAAREMEEDTATLSNMDDFLDVMGRVNVDIEIIRSIIAKAEHDINYTWGQRASRSLRALPAYVQRYAGRIKRNRHRQLSH